MLRRRRHNTPVSVAVTPATPSLTHPDTQQFTATMANVHGNAVTTAGAWSSSDPIKATISASGLATTVADVLLSGQTATGGTTLTVVDAGQTHVVNAYVGKTLAVTAGTNVGESRTIVSNTATTFTVSAVFTAATDATTVFSVTNGGSGDTDINFAVTRPVVTDATPAVLTVSP